MKDSINVTIAPGVTYRTKGTPRFEVRYCDNTQVSHHNSIVTKPKQFGFKLAGVQAIALGFLAKYELNQDCDDNKYKIEHLRTKIVNFKFNLKDNLTISNICSEIKRVIIEEFAYTNINLLDDYVSKINIISLNDTSLFDEKVSDTSCDRDIFIDSINDHVSSISKSIVIEAADVYASAQKRNGIIHIKPFTDEEDETKPIDTIDTTDKRQLEQRERHHAALIRVLSDIAAGM